MAIFRGVGGAVGSTTSAVISEATEAAQTATEKAAEAAASASNAATSKINAATSASNALSSATSAAASAALYEDFLDRYLGAKTTEPTTDNDGNPLQVGVLYYSENDKELLVWSGSAWVSPLVSPAIRDGFTGNGSTVAFTLSRDPSTEANTQVFINGIYQNKTTYSVSGTTLTFSTPPEDGDSIEVMSQKSTSVLMADTDNATYTATDAGAVTRTLNEKLGDTVSVKDFGAVGDGVTDDTAAIQLAVTAAANAGGSLFFPAGNYYVTSTITVPNVAGDYFSKNGINIIGEARSQTVIETDQDIAVFNLSDFTHFRHLTVKQTGTAGTGKAFYDAGQIRFCTFEDLAVISFKYGCLFRYTLWCSWRDIYFVGCTCGVRLARNDSMEDQANPSAPGSWNAVPGWFHNQLTFDNILCNQGEIGIWASCMGATFNNVTCQNQTTDGTTNSVLPVGTKGTGMWLEGGGTATDTFNNVIINYYVEDSYNGLVIKEHDHCVINGFFIQGYAGGETVLDVDGSMVSLTGFTSQTSGFTNAVVANNSKINSTDRIIVSGAIRSLTASYLNENGTTGGNPISTFTVTATPETSGTITLNSAEDQMGYERVGNTITVTGRIDPSALSSPVGNFMTIDGLPFPVANLNERAGNSSGNCCGFVGGATNSLPVLALENASSFRIYFDVSTMTTSDSYYISLTYLTDD